MKKRFWIILQMSLLSTLSLFAIDDLQLHLKVTSLEKASSPEFYFGKILFTASPEESTRHVGIAFAHEDYQRIHSFQKNEMGLFFYLMEAPDREFLEYRMIVDGIWQPDPQAEQQVRGINGLKLSQLNIPQNQRPATPSPIIQRNGMVTFLFESRPGDMVYLAGDFNQWDPYMIPLTEVDKGVFQAEIFLTEGVHFYNFFVNGEVLLDPQNRNIRVNSFGEEVSFLMVP